MAAYARWNPKSAEERRSETAPARAGYDARWLRLADPDGLLGDAERRRRADGLLKEHITRMAYARLRKQHRTKPVGGLSSIGNEPGER
jgi:hypothetical protein